MSAAAPLTVIAGVVTTAYASFPALGIPVGFITIAVVLALFSVGYVAMSRHISNAGAFYTYVSHGLGRPLGVGTAWMALLAYNALQIGLYGIIGSAMEPVLAEFDITMEWWVVALIIWAIVAILGVLRVDVNGKVLAILLVSEILIVLVYDFFFLSQPAEGTSLNFDTLMPDALFGVGGVAVLGAVLVVTFLGFVGFESAVVFSEESKNPRRTVAMATYLSVFIIAAVYAVSSWAMSVATGTANISQASAENGPTLIFGLAAERTSMVFVRIGTVLFATSVLAAAISFHNTVARYTFALGRERVFPSFLSSTGRRSGAPMAGSIVQSILGLVVIVLYAVLALEPVTQLFFLFGTGGGFGVMVLVTLTSIAVIAFFARQTNGENLWRRLIAPLIAFLALAAVTYYAVKDFHNLVLLDESNPLRWIIPVLYPAVFVLGILWALILKATRPEVYQSIGLGANSATGVSGQSRVLPAEYAAQHGTGQDTTLR
jgi:amino acid transporter